MARLPSAQGAPVGGIQRGMNDDQPGGGCPDIGRDCRQSDHIGVARPSARNTPGLSAGCRPGGRGTAKPMTSS